MKTFLQKFLQMTSIQDFHAGDHSEIAESFHARNYAEELCMRDYLLGFSTHVTQRGAADLIASRIPPGHIVWWLGCGVVGLLGCGVSNTNSNNSNTTKSTQTPTPSTPPTTHQQHHEHQQHQQSKEDKRTPKTRKNTQNQPKIGLGGAQKHPKMEAKSKKNALDRLKWPQIGTKGGQGQ